MKRISNRIANWNLQWFIAWALPVLLAAFGQQVQADTYATPGNYTWTAPAGVTSVLVEAWGGGGAGGGATGNPSGGGGGAGGQYAAKTVTVVPGAAYAVVVGAGGNGGTGNGPVGGDSSFNVNWVVAKGGAGGTAATSGGSGGAGGSGSSTGGAGTTLYAGGSGSAGIASLLSLSYWGGAGGGGAGSGGAGGNASGTTAGAGIANGGGDGAAGRTSSGNGYVGNAAGGGGGGGYAGGSTDRNGGNGAAGKVIITVPASPPTLTTGAASGVAGSSATLNGTVTSNGAQTSAYFQYGRDTGYGSQSSTSTLSASASNAAFSAVVSGLTCQVTYHFRAVATNAAGTSYGSDATFTTPACPVALSKTASTTSASVGQYIMFPITASNPNGSGDLGPLTVTDVLPAGLSYQSSYAEHGAVTVNGQEVDWTLQTLPAGASETLTLVVIPTQKGTYTNSATSGTVTATAPLVAISGAYVHYRMDETAGSWVGTTGEVVDSGSKHLNGTRTNTASTTQADPITPSVSNSIANQYPAVTGGGFCNAGKFDGNTMVTVSHSDFFQFTTNMSATTWIWPSGYPNGTTSDLYSIMSNDVNYEFHINPQGKLYWWFYLNGTAYSMTSASTIPTNKWTHVAIAMDTTSAAKIYINGVLDATMAISGGPTLTANPCGFYLGGDIATSNPPGASCNLIQSRAFRGMIDEAKIYDYTLGAAEVQADMIQGRQCSGSYFDHIQLEFNGAASTCASKTVTVKACMDTSCTSLYTQPVAVTLSPTGVWGTNPLTFTGIGSALIDASKLGGAGTLTIGTSSVNPSGNNLTRCFNGSTETCNVSVVAPVSCPFDAVEGGANPGTDLYTKLVGTTFNADILALNGSTLNYNFVGPVAVDLVDATPGNCPSGTGLTTPQTVNFSAANFGRQTAAFTYADAAKNVRLRMKGGASSVSGYYCSSDNFAIRPPSVTLATVEPLGTAPSATDTNVLKAGNPFTLRATAASSYAGTLTLDATRLTAQDPGNATTVATGGVVGVLTPNSLTGNDLVSLGNAAYTEVGYLYLGNGAYVDNTFTAVDRGNGDCVTDVTSDNNLSNTPNAAGKYGCDVGSAPASLGRFVPDHFETAALGTMACPTGLTCPTGSGIAYSGQPLASTASRVPLKVTAATTGGAVTKNYTGYFAKPVILSIFDAAGSTATTNASSGALAGNSVAATSFAETRDPVTNAVTKTSGVAWPAPTFTFTNWPTAPTDIYFRAAETGGDGVTSLRSPAGSSVEGGIKMVTGRLKMSNATGSEKRSLSVPVETDYWSGLAWVLNNQDNVTNFTSASVFRAAPPAGPSVASRTTVTVQPVSTGKWNLVLSPPAPSVGSVDLAIDLGNTSTDNSCLATHGTALTAVGAPWLRGTCAGGSAGQADPSARATFGIYAPETRRTVHVRELN